MDQLKQVETGIARLGVWIDTPNKGMDPLAQLLFRIGKVSEEKGEVWEGLIGVCGQNPRKGVTHVWEDVDKELLDTAVAALGALEHRHGNSGVVAEMLLAHVNKLLYRAGLSPIGGPAVQVGDRIRVLEWDNRDARYTTKPPTPQLAEVAYMGTNVYAGQPSIDVDLDGGGRITCFAARWELANVR